MALKKIGARLKIRAGIIVLFLLFLPAFVTLVLHNVTTEENFEMYLAIHVSLSLSSLSFLPALLVRFFIGRKLKEMNEYCVFLKEGKFRAVMPDLDELDPNPDQLQLLRQNMAWLARSIAARDGRLTNALATTQQHNLKLNEITLTDHLSGVYNKRFFDINFRKICARKMQSAEPVHLIMIDCDHFKTINDALGHAVGDIVIARLGTLLKNSVREYDDYPFRFGGDEFGCIFCGASPQRCIRFAEDLRRQFSRLDFGEICLSLSIGIATLEKEMGGDPVAAADRLFAQADKALYQSKNNGRNQVTFYTEEG